MPLSSKRTRILIGAILLSVVAGLLWLDYALRSRVIASAVVVLLGLAGFLEYTRLARLARRDAGGGLLLAAWGFLGTAYYLAIAWVEGANGALPSEFFVGGLVVFLLGGIVLLVFREDFLAGIPPLLAAFLGVVLFGVLFSYVLRIYHRGESDEALLIGAVFCFGVKGTDIVAYLVGSSLGRHHFLKASPGKTLEGSTAALAFGGAWFCGAALLWEEHFLGWPLGIASGIILALASSLGDLSESLIKRYYRVKDSGSLLPHYGGVLDLIDSFLFSGYVFWCLLLTADSWK